MGDTWGISGPAFLVVYALGLAAVWGSGWLARRRLAGPPPPEPIEVHVYEAAMLAGGEDLVATAAMARLWTADIIEAGDGWLRESFEAAELRRLPDAATPLRVGPRVELDHPVETAVYEAVRNGGDLRPDEVRAEAAASAAFAALRRRLEDRRLLYDAGSRVELRWQNAWYVPLLAIGAYRVMVGVERGKPVAYLVVLLVVTAVLLGSDFRPPRRTPAGDRALKEERNSERELAAETRSGEIAVSSLPLAVALFGTAALWSTDPWLAAALGVSYRSMGPAFLSSVGSGCGGGSGGCGGGGGGGCGG